MKFRQWLGRKIAGVQIKPTSHAMNMVKAQRSFDAAAVNRLTNDWTTTNKSIDSILWQDLDKLRARSRDLAINSPFGIKFLTMLKTNVLGSGGIGLKNKARDPDTYSGGKVSPGAFDTRANKLIEDAWWDWGRPQNCTVAKNISWEEVQAVCLETVARDGEPLIRKVRGPFNKYGFALQLLEIDLLDTCLNVPARNGNNEIRMGKEINSWGECVAYHLFNYSPTDYLANYTWKSRQYQRVPASEIVHPYILRSIGQTRGYPWLAPVMNAVNMLNGYSDAVLVASRAGAAKMGFFETETPEGWTGEEDGNGNLITEASAGQLEKLPMGVKFKPHDPTQPTEIYASYVKACLREIACGLNVSYATFANDLESVNFSSGRMGLMDERDGWKAIQCWFGEHFCNPIFSDWLESSLAFGAIPLPLSKFEKFNQAAWQGRRWDWVDPVKEVAAKVEQMKWCLTSLSRICAEQNIDRDELLDEIADDKVAMESRDLEFIDIEMAMQKQEAQQAQSVAAQE